jgi:hypothetical protein
MLTSLICFPLSSGLEAKCAGWSGLSHILRAVVDVYVASVEWLLAEKNWRKVFVFVIFFRRLHILNCFGIECSDAFTAVMF